MRDVPQRPYTDHERETITKMIAAGHSSREVAERLGRTRNSVIAVSNRERLGTWKFSNNKGSGSQWMPKPGLKRAPRATVTPAELEIITRLIAEGKSAAEIGDALGRTKRSVIHIVTYRHMGPFLSRSGPKPSEMIIPDDFAERWVYTTHAILGRHYRVGNATVTKWARELGLVRERKVPERRVSNPTIDYTPRAVSRIPGHKPAPFANIFRDPTPAGRAADILRKDGWRVHRCNATGIYDPKGNMWQCGRVRVTEAELIERADRVLSRKMAA